MSQIVARFAHYMSEYEGVEIPMQIFDSQSNRIFAGAVSLSSDGTRIPKDLAPGKYLVRAALPSGEILADTITVHADSAAKAVLKPKRPSPREELSWAYYLQRGAANLQAAWAASPFNAHSVPAPSNVPELQFWLHTPANWTRIRETDASIFRNVTVDAAPDLQRAGVLARIVVEFNKSGEWREFPGQIWLEAKTTRSQFIALPLVQNLQAIIANSPENSSAPFHIQVSNGNAAVEALLGFMDTGDFESARLIGSAWLEKAEQLLFAKFEDPIAATVAGYFLLRAGELDRLHNWTENLANWFDWLPDGPVIRAWHLINSGDATGQSDQDEEPIRRMLLKAVDRGIPYYRMGLRLLQSGLKLLLQRNASDMVIREASQTVDPYLLNIDPHSQVTSFFGMIPGLGHNKPIRRVA